MKHFVMAIALGAVLSVPALAGEVPTSGFVPPQPPVATGTNNNPSNDVPTSAIENFLLTIFSTFVG
ncbi:MAG: hypothetical protein ABI967_12855 [bacterium]